MSYDQKLKDAADFEAAYCEGLDIPTLIEHIDPEWREHFPDEYMAFDHYVVWGEGPKWLLEMIKESEA